MIKRNRILSLDGLRAISIILVLLGHSYSTVPTHNDVLDKFMLFLGNAHIGVMFFFVMSGYLITYLLRNELEEKETINLCGFYSRRALRIFPAFYSYLAIITCLVVVGAIATSSSEILSAATFSINYSHLWNHFSSGEYYWFVGHFWTLSLEEQFYIFWPLTLLTIGLHKGKSVAQLIIIACPIIRVLTYIFWPEVREELGLMLHTAADSLMFGCVVALSEGGSRFEALVKRLSNGAIPVMATLLTFVVSPILSAKFRGAYDLSIGITIESVSIAIILLYVTRHPKGLIGRILNSKVAVSIGVLSYSLYLWQQLFLTPLNTTWTGRYPTNLIVCLSVALISYHMIEKPFLRLKNRVHKDRNTP